jgi:hypothetical protein
MSEPWKFGPEKVEIPGAQDARLSEGNSVTLGQAA